MPRIYGTLEVTKKVMIFHVFKKQATRWTLLFSHEINNEEAWLDSQDQIKNLNLAAFKLNAVIQEFQHQFPFFKLIKMALILPATYLQIKTITKDFWLNEKKTAGLITTDFLERLQSELDSTTDQNFLLDNQTLSWQLDGQFHDFKTLKNQTGRLLRTEMLCYELPKAIVISHQKLLNLINIECLWLTTSLQAAVRNFATQDLIANPLILVNWKTDSLEVGYFNQGLLQKVVVIPQGFAFILANLSRQLALPEKVLQHYLFELIDFSQVHDLQKNICQTWDHRQKMLKKYTLHAFQEIIGRELQKLYLFALKKLFYNLLPPTTFVTYHWGFLAKMTGADQLLAALTHGVHCVPHFELFGGWGHNFLETALGVVCLLDKINDYVDNHQVYTSLGKFPKPFLANQKMVFQPHQQQWKWVMNAKLTAQD